MQRRLIVLIVASMLFVGARARAIDIVLDYTIDEQNWNWFSGTTAGQERRAALDAAAGFLSAILTDDDWASVTIDSATIGLSDIFQSTINDMDGQPAAGTPESDGAGYYYNLPITNRSTAGANEFVVYVTAFAFDTGTSGHAKAGPNGAARRNAAGISGDAFNTWGGDVQFDLSESWYTGQNPGIDPTDDYGFQDPNKNPTTDIPTDDWDFSTSTFTWKGFDLERIDPAADGKFDLYATSVHELIHTLGVTTANLPAYIGTNAQGELIGENVVSVYGGPVPATGGHVAQNTESTVWGSDGYVSEASLDPNALRGRRKYLTDLDAALLRDLGYAVATEFPTQTLEGDFNGDGAVNAADYTVWRDGLGVTFGPEDYGVWSAAYGSVAAEGAFTSGAPEPGAGLLVMLAGLARFAAGPSARRGL